MNSIGAHCSSLLSAPPRQLELGRVLDCGGTGLVDIAIKQVLGERSAGWWECELPGDRLSWTTGIYDIFGLPRGAEVTREEAVSLYCEQSRALMEKLRGFAIGKREAFALDAQIKPASGAATRWMRLIAVPICESEQSVALHGLKLLI